MSSLAIGVFQNDALKSLHSNCLLESTAWTRRLEHGYQTFKMTSARQFYDDGGFLVTVDDLRGFSIVVASPEDSFPLNRATFGRVQKAFKEADNHLTFEVRASLDALVATGVHQRELFENQTKRPNVDILPTALPGETDALLNVIEQPTSERKQLEFVFEGLRFDFLKDEPIDLLTIPSDSPERSMEQNQFDQFIVNLDAWDQSKKTAEPIRISLAAERPKTSLQAIARSSAIAGNEQRTKPILTLDEQLKIRVQETEIVDLSISGRLVLNGALRGVDYGVDYGNAGFTNDNLIQKQTCFPPNSGTLTEAPDHFVFKAADVRPNAPTYLYEYLLNRRIVTDETIPIYLAYNKVRSQLVLQAKINPFFAPRITSLKISIVCSSQLRENSVRCSHVGVPIDNSFIVAIERQQFLSEQIQLKFQLQESGINFSKVIAVCTISKTLVDFEFKPRTDNDCAALQIENRLTVDYTLVL